MKSSEGLASTALASLAIALVIWAICLINLGPVTSFWFEVTLNISAEGSTQLFWDSTGGTGASEANSATLPATRVGESASFRFPLPEGTYGSFRLDPINRSAQVVVTDARIVRRSSWGLPKHVLATIPAARIHAGNQIKSMTIHGNEVQVVTVDDANDPTLLIDLETPLHLKRPMLEYAVMLAALAFATALVGIVLQLTRRLQVRVGAAIRRGWQWAALRSASNPYAAICAVGIAATVLSCYPVIFFGKSFVSPDDGGVPMLYDRAPFLPDYSSNGIEDMTGTDVGALMWQHVSYAAIQRHALLEDHELPLWNRYNSSGTPLLGQGLSMLGDPLNLAVVLAGATMWAWDVKFILAKILFAVGVGLTVFACTRQLPASLILTFSSAYIGFFDYRFNHPAVFALTYSPWILYCWIRIVHTPEVMAPNQVRWLVGLVFANWMVLNSGTVKEAYMLLVFLNLTGTFIFLLHSEPLRDKARKGARVLLAQCAFVMISAPLWWTFIDLLQKSFSTYDTPAAHQIPPTLFIGLFDDIFYRALTPGESKLLPSANFLTLLGCLWAVARFRALSADRTFLGLALGTFIALALAFTVVPSSVIVKIPFLANVVHINNTFSVVAIVQLLVLAGYGMSECLNGRSTKSWPWDMAFTVVTLGILLVLYLYEARALSKSAFFVMYTTVLLVSFVMLQWLLRRVARAEASLVVALWILISFAALHWRYGLYLHNGFDKYVTNPQTRASLQAKSSAIEFIKHASPLPLRAVGFDNVLFPGFNGAIGIESFYGCDPLQSPFYRELVQNTFNDWVWRSVVSKNGLDQLRPLYDLLNVGYYLTYPSADAEPLPGLKLDGRFDLDVYESPTAWPRAFFTNQLSTYDSVSQLHGMITSGPTGPFAAMQPVDIGGSPSLSNLLLASGSGAHSVVVPATNYTLTSNTTSFTVDAPEQGIVVLSEVYSEGDFNATLNGKNVPILRTNHAFKGIEIREPGTQTIKISYWPRHFTLMVLASIAGLALLAGWAAAFGRHPTRSKTP